MHEDGYRFAIHINLSKIIKYLLTAIVGIVVATRCNIGEILLLGALVFAGILFHSIMKS